MDSKEAKENSLERKQIEDNEYISFAGKYDPSDDKENDPEPEDMNDQLWVPDNEDEDEEGDYDEDDGY